MTEFPIHIDTISIRFSILVCHIYVVFMSLKAVLILANRADYDKMQQYVAFYLGLLF